MSGLDGAIDWVDDRVTERPLLVVVAFLLVSAVAAGGLGGIETQAGGDQFQEDVPAQQALEDIDEEFGASVGETPRTAQLLVEGDNVLSRPALERILESQHRLETRAGLRVESTRSHANVVASELDPTAKTPAEQRRAVASATPSQLAAAIERADESGRLAGQLSTDYRPVAQRAGTALVVVSYDLPESAGTAEVTPLQQRSVTVLDGVPGNEMGETAYLFGQGILEQEITALLTDTSIVVFPAALAFILVFLLIAYRDPIDMGLGLVALVMTMLWTFGFMGYADIPFSDSLVTVFPLLLAVGIDFGIHTINRYREERLEGSDIDTAMRTTTDQLLVAFFLVMVTTVVSLLANLTSTLSSTRNFGLVAAMGMVFTFVIFGGFLPAGKVLVDRWRERLPIPSFDTTPLGEGGSLLGRIQLVGVDLARIAPVIVVIVVLVGGGVAGGYGTGVDTEFSQEAFFPTEDRIELYESFPAPFSPTDYTFIEILDIFADDFDQGQFNSVTLYVDQSVRDDDALELLDRTTHNPPDSFARAPDGTARASSVVTVIEEYATADEEFGRLVATSDRLGTGVPDRDVDAVYDALLDSPRSDQARNYLAADRGSAIVEFTIEGADVDGGTAVADAQAIADRSPLDAVVTGQLAVNEAVIDALLESAIRSLFAAILLTAVFLVVTYRLLEGRLAYGMINLLPVLVTVGVLVGTMRLMDIPLTPINAPILSVSIGLGVDYTVHFTHRFVDEYQRGTPLAEALRVTVRGTGGALTGSMLTTVTGLGVLYLALIPLIQDFGILLALGVLYAYLSAIFFVPSLIVVWDRYAPPGLGI
ncbi:putative exporter of the RND superfamily [Halanaeroarchaeum sp. HSR-CO]|uniref:efflux RND transporter permease subunit n=1 Tax=Halanaeroarchaeum sp. HSR-CO TaxID=2866382 RepID=UPI00217D7337|nr:MMPL family transporter [Halanaeroarchaeum sp. HSR-CO]UWG46690.1 putative exporter of the RND superfamily [Halanaeroarchaeum sp. HSR-CO]